MARGKGRAYRSILAAKEELKLRGSASEIDAAAARRAAEMQSAGSERSLWSSLGTLLGMAAAYYFLPAGASFVQSAFGYGVGSWAGGELGETVYDASRGTPGTSLGVEVPKGMFFQGEREDLSQGITDIESGLGDAWDLLLEEMDETQLAQAVSTGISFGMLSPGSDKMWAKMFGKGAGNMGFKEKISAMNVLNMLNPFKDKQ